MKRKRFTEEQIIGILREHEAGAKTADLARKHGLSEARCATNSSMRPCSSISIRPGKSLPNGLKTTIPHGHTRPWPTKHRQHLLPNSPQQACTLRSLTAPRSGLLLNLPKRAYNCRRL